MWKSCPSACSVCPASNRPSSWGTATRGSASSHHPEGEPGVAAEREGGQGTSRKESPFCSLSFLQTMLDWGKSQSYPPCSSQTSSIFPFLRCLSLSYSPTNTGKTVPHLFFSPHFRHRPLTSSIARPPFFRFPSSYNYPFCPFLIRAFVPYLSVATCQKPTSFKSLCDFAHNDISWMIFLTTSSLRSCYAKCYIQCMFHSLTGAHTKKAGARQVMPEEKSKSSKVRGLREAGRRRIYCFFVSFVLCQQNNLKNNLYLLSVFTYSVY